jgi:iron-sulfur cluster repair protein YtfE (RIC family)
MTLHELLVADHVQLRHRIAQIQTSLVKKPAELEALYLSFHQEARAHFRKEDEVYYPYVDGDKKMGDREMMHTLRNDHAAVIFALESLAIRLRKKVPLEEWKSKFQALIDVLLPHFDTEEKKLFPEVERVISPAELRSLLEKIQSLR